MFLGFVLQTLMQHDMRIGAWDHDWDVFLDHSKQVVKSSCCLTGVMLNMSRTHLRPHSPSCLWLFFPDIKYVLIGTGVGLLLAAIFIIVNICLIRKQVQVHDSIGEVMDWIHFLHIYDKNYLKGGFYNKICNCPSLQRTAWGDHQW